MLVTLRYITPEITGEPLGDLSLSTGIKFTDVSNGLPATSILATMGYIALKIAGKPPGYITPEIARKLPSDLSPFVVLKFTSVSRRCS